MTTYNRSVKPRIAIPVPTLSDATYNNLNWQAYADAIESGGGSAVRVPLQTSDGDLRELAVTCEGILLPGSPADVLPEHYGQERQEFTADADLAREQVDRILLEEAWGGGKPLLAICFGMQMLNVWRGGTLLQDLSPMPLNHSAGRGVAIAHSVLLDASSSLGRIVGVTKVSGAEVQSKLWVNSSHHQAVGYPGKGLRVSGRSTEDGVIEAVEAEHEQVFLIGVQWHPERTISTSVASRLIFEEFIRKCVVHREAESLNRAGA